MKKRTSQLLTFTRGKCNFCYVLLPPMILTMMWIKITKANMYVQNKFNMSYYAELQRSHLTIIRTAWSASNSLLKTPYSDSNYYLHELVHVCNTQSALTWSDFLNRSHASLTLKSDQGNWNWNANASFVEVLLSKFWKLLSKANKSVFFSFLLFLLLFRCLFAKSRKSVPVNTHVRTNKSSTDLRSEN